MNPCGGAEMLTLVTMEAILEMGIDIELTTLEEPNLKIIEKSFGKNLASVLKRVKKVNVMQRVDRQSISDNIKNGYDLIINTHADIIPYFDKLMSKGNSISYCHFPTAKYCIEAEDKDYLERYLKTTRSSSSTLTLPSPSTLVPSPSISPLSASANSTAINTSSSAKIIQIKEDGKNNSNGDSNFEFDRKGYLAWLKDTYDNMMTNTTILTNSRYSSKAISDDFGINQPVVLSPPVDVDKFRKGALLSLGPGYGKNKKRKTVLVLCRIDPYKEIENAIDLARLLKAKNIGDGMIISGNLDPYYADYYDSLNKMISRSDLEDYVKIKTNVHIDDLISFMKKSQVYFHPRSKEHFGMSIVEAMSAGLVPIVPDMGGQTEFVPEKYQFHSLEQAAEIISSAFDMAYSERKGISDSVQRFSISNYKNSFQQIVTEMMR
jgi:hypothetical protein